MKILEMLLDLGFKDTGHKYADLTIMAREQQRILYNPKDDQIDKYYKVNAIGSVQLEDIQRLQKQ